MNSKESNGFIVGKMYSMSADHLPNRKYSRKFLVLRTVGLGYEKGEFRILELNSEDGIMETVRTRRIYDEY